MQGICKIWIPVTKINGQNLSVTWAQVYDGFMNQHCRFDGEETRLSLDACRTQGRGRAGKPSPEILERPKK